MSKNYLYLDSSLDINIGVLDDSYHWLHHETVSNRKGSRILHSIIHSSLDTVNLSVSDISAIIIANGPGSYTGIRLSEGIAQVLSLEKIATYSFYHFEAPFFCNIDKYSFFANAFKGEVFEYKYDHGQESHNMISDNDFTERSFEEDNLYHINGELKDRYMESTSSLIKKYPANIFSKVIGRGAHQEPFYFRSAEKEFKPTQLINSDGKRG